jgi:hypothetical protein
VVLRAFLAVLEQQWVIAVRPHIIRTPLLRHRRLQKRKLRSPGHITNGIPMRRRFVAIPAAADARIMCWVQVHAVLWIAVH